MLKSGPQSLQMVCEYFGLPADCTKRGSTSRKKRSFDAILPTARSTQFGKKARYALSSAGMRSSRRCGRRRSAAPSSPERRGWTFTVQAVAQAGRSISAPWTATRSLRSAAFCSACGALGVQATRLCRYHRVARGAAGRKVEQEHASRIPARSSAQRRRT